MTSFVNVDETFCPEKKKKKSEKSKFILRIQIYFPTLKIMKYVNFK